MKSRIVLIATAIWLGCLSPAMAILQYSMTVTNIAELRSLDVANVSNMEVAGVNPTVYVLGYYTSGDRGGGTFQWDPNCSTSSDGGRYFTTNGWTSGNGRWVRMLNGEVANVKMWGATGNGFTNDTAAIQNALNSVYYNWNEEMLFPSGTYLLTNTIVFGSGVHIRGEGVLNNTLVVMRGSNDVFRTSNAQAALTGGTIDYDHGVIFENLDVQMDTNATGNAALVLCLPGEASTIRNLLISGGGYGIRVFGGGAPGLQISHVHVSDAYVAGVSVEGYLPSGTWLGGFSAMNLTSLSGDHHRADSDATASLLRIERCVGGCSVYDFKAEGSWGGGLFYYNRSLGGTNVDGQMGSLTIYGGGYNCGDTNCDFVVLRSEANRTASVLIHPVSIFGIGHLIRDDANGRKIDPALYDAADGLALDQSLCRLPVQYESYSSYSRFVVGNTALVAFVPTVTNAWYRIVQGNFKVGGRYIINGWQQSSEFSLDINAPVGGDGTLFNIIRATKSASGVWPSGVTQARAGGYWDPSVSGYRPFVDIYVDHGFNFGDSRLDKIVVAHPIDSDVYTYGGVVPLSVPTGPVTSLVPPGCTLINSNGVSLIR